MKFITYDEKKKTFAQLFGLNQFNISGSNYDFIHEDGKKNSPRRLWLITTYLFSPPIDIFSTYERKGKPDYMLQGREDVYFAMLHTDEWSKALIWYPNIHHLNEGSDKQTFPYTVNVNPDYDFVYIALKNMDLTYNDTGSINSSHSSSTTVEYYSPHISSRVFYPYNISRDIMSVSLKLFWNSVIKTGVYIAEQYNDDRLAQQFRPYLSQLYDINGNDDDEDKS